MTDFKELREALEALQPEEWSALTCESNGIIDIVDFEFGVVCEHVCTSEYARLIAAANPAVIHSLLAELDEARKDASSKQARIDALMLEYCPDEMTAEQIADWGAAQVAAEPSPAIDAAMKEQQP